MIYNLSISFKLIYDLCEAMHLFIFCIRIHSSTECFVFVINQLSAEENPASSLHCTTYSLGCVKCVFLFAFGSRLASVACLFQLGTLEFVIYVNSIGRAFKFRLDPSVFFGFSCFFYENVHRQIEMLLFAPGCQ